MDKELLRVVIIATGLLFIVGMLAWHFLKNKNFSESWDFLSNNQFGSKIDDSLVLHDELDDFDVVPVKKSVENATQSTLHTEDDFDDLALEDDDYYEPPPRFVAPDIIQLVVMAKHEEGFNGQALVDVFKLANLHYGSLKIFERLDVNRLVDFGVACLVEPGTFPETGLVDFYCPGVVFFMQPGIMDDAPRVFNDFLSTVNFVAEEMDGDILDHERTPLTNATIQLIRQSI